MRRRGRRRRFSARVPTPWKKIDKDFLVSSFPIKLTSMGKRLKNQGMKFLDDTSRKARERCGSRRTFSSGAINLKKSFTFITASLVPRTLEGSGSMTAVAEEACCRFCFEGGVLEAPCECDGTLKFVHLCCLHRWQAEQMLRGGGLVGDSRATRCQVCKALYTTRPPQASELLALVRGREGASLAALIRPGCLLVARDAVLDESTLARAPAWLRWEISRKRRHWHRAVFLLTRVDDAGSDYGDDIIIGVNITRVRSESDDIEERREFKPEDAEGLTSSDSDSDSASDPEEDARPRRRRRRLHESSDNSSESIGPDGPIHSPPRPHVTIDEEDSDVDLNTPHVRAYVGGPVKPELRVVLHVSSGEGDVLSLPTATIPLSHEEEGDRPVDGSVTARVFHQRRRAEDAHVDEVTGEAAAAAMAAAGDDVEPSPAVHVFHGHARWSRVQLMNEIARGAWGLCLAEPEDLTGRWRGGGEAYWRALIDSCRPVFSRTSGDDP